MSIALFDVQTGFGGPVKGETETVTAGDLLDQLDRLEIAGALVRTVPDDVLYDAVDANDEIFDVCEAHEELVPCPILIPNGGYDLPSETEQVADAIARGAGAACLRPRADRWELDEWCSGNLLRALEQRRLPAFCENGKFELRDVASVAGRYPALPIILAGLQYLQQRSVVPLLETFPNVYLAIGSNYVVYQGLELLVDKVGPERLLFGTGFPKAEAMAAVTMLVYADIPDEAKRLIGAGNFQRIIEGIER